MLHISSNRIFERKTLFRVVIVHLVLILFLFIGSPTYQIKKNKKLQVRDVVVIPKKETKEIIKQQPIANAKKEIAKKVVKKPILKRQESNTNNLLREIEKSLDKIEKKEVKKAKSQLTIPKKIKPLKIEASIDKELSPNKIVQSYEEQLVDELQSRLHFPAFGKVKVKISINGFGKINHLEIISSENEKNKQYLKNTLPHLVFPWFNHYCSQNEVKEIVILFKNE